MPDEDCCKKPKCNYRKWARSVWGPGAGVGPKTRGELGQDAHDAAPGAKGWRQWASSATEG